MANPKLAQAIEEHRRGNLKVAEVFYREILLENPNDADAMHLLGVIAIQSEDFSSAIALIERAIAIQPKAEFYGNLGVGLEKMNRLQESQQAYEKALTIKPDYFEALLNLGVVHSRQRDFQKAIASYTLATQLAPLSFKAWHNLGISHSEFGNTHEALFAFDQAKRIDPHDANVYANLGLVYVAQSDVEAAKAAFEKALSLDSKHVQANKQLAILYRAQEQYDKAIQFAKQSFVHSNNDLECKLLLVDLVQRTHTWDELTNDLKPEAIAEDLLGRITSLVCDEESASRKPSNDLIFQSLPLVSPLSILSMPCEVASRVIATFAKRWADSQSVGENYLGTSRVPTNATSRRTRVGYLSADFRSHPVGYCVAEMIESHDRNRFEVFGYSIGYDDGSQIRQRLRHVFDHWIDLSALSDQAAADRIRANKIDILIDLQGYTEGARTKILSLRPAPIQVNYLGFPGTMGASFIDYILVDEYVSPEESRDTFHETPLCLPGCYLPRDSQRTNLEIHRSRSEVGLPDNAFVFCAFSSPHKITSDMFDCWLRVLSQVPASVLWLRSSNLDAEARLRLRAAKHGIEIDRLIFAPLVSTEEHLARQRLADLFLDTYPYNQHSTAQDALALGLPLLTMSGTNFPSRVAGSLLISLGLPDLISTSLVEYENKAIAYALDQEQQQIVRERLRAALRSGKLPDGKSSAQKLEMAFDTMMKRSQAKVSSISKFERAFQLHTARNYPAAESLYKELLVTDECNPDVLEGLGILMVHTGRTQEGIGFLQRAVAASPKVAQRHFNLGQAFNMNHQVDEALAEWLATINLEPAFLDAWNAIAQASIRFRRWNDARQALERSLSLDPQQVERQCDLADVFFELSEFETAKARYLNLLAASPDHVRALNNCANLFKLEGRFVEAAQFYERALQLDPEKAFLYFNLANVLILLNLADKAIAAYQRALEQDPQYIDALVGLGSLHLRLQDYSKALACFEQAYSLNSENICVLENLIKVKQSLCLWGDLEQLEEKVLRLAAETEQSPRPYALAPFFGLSRSQPTTRVQQLSIAKRYCERLKKENGFPRACFRSEDVEVRKVSSSNRRLRIGYLSADFRAHPIGMAMSQVIPNHDPQRFEIHAYSFGPNDGSVWRSQVENGADRFIDMEQWPIQKSVERIVADQIDILVDLQGHIGDPRPEILMRRPAPIQAHYLGFPATSGADFIDYDLVDEYVAPRDSQGAFTEKLVYLPGCLLTSHAQSIQIDSQPDRVSLGLPVSDFVFCAFHSPFKLNPTMTDVWAKLLRETPRSILWLQQVDSAAMNNIRREFEDRGIASERLCFAPRVSPSQHIARQRCADLFLDSFPYNAHTTACDTLSTTLPIVTLSGETIASRIAGSVLHTLGLDELITKTHEEYFHVALQLSQQPAKLTRLREKIGRALTTTDLYDGAAFARKLEAAFEAMWQNYCHGNRPIQIDLTNRNT